MQNIKSQFKYTMDLGVSATKATFKLRKTKKDTTTHILVIVFMFIMAGVLVWDILRDASFTIDLILLIALVVIEILGLIMPRIIIHTQKKFLKQLNLDEMDYTITEISKGKCTETYYKNNKIVMQNVCDISKLVAYEINDNYAYVVFNNFACAIFDLTTLNVSKEELIQTLDTTIAKNKSIKSKKKS
ncbi:MAG: hypothetical protein IJ371_06120 [Clostridia bacterium]|nr:hypothetical protein [Clostridia bacterium]